MRDFATIDEITKLKRALTTAEQERAKTLLPVVSAVLRDEARKIGKDLDQMIADGYPSEETVKSVVADIVLRELNAPVDDEAVSQVSQGALGYTLSYTPLAPGGGLFIKKAELARLGLRRQMIRNLELI